MESLTDAVGDLIDLETERERLQRRLADTDAERTRAETKLANPGFRDNAPEDVVLAEKLKVERFEREAESLREQLTELLGYVSGQLPAGHPFARLSEVLPGSPHRPEPWLLGSSPQSAVWAAELGLAYCFADFINPDGAAIVEDYRRRFAPSEAEPTPRTAIGVVAICAETDEEAERLAASHRMAFSLLRQGRLIPVPTVEEGLRYAESRPRRQSSRRFLLGSPPTVHAGIVRAAEEYGVEEVFLLTITHGNEARRRSYELLAEEMGLGTRRDESIVPDVR